MGWTLKTLKKHLDGVRTDRDKRYEQRFEAQEKAVVAALAAAEKAVTKAEAAAEKRFDAVNEFRGQLNDQAATFVPRTEYNQRCASLEEKVASVIKVCVGAVFLGIAIITVVLLILRH